MGNVNRVRAPDAAGYDTDLYQWAMDQAARLRALAVPGLDTANLAEEIESVGRSQRRELSSRTTLLLLHLLKWQFQPEQRGTSWISTIDEQRDQIAGILADSPSLRPGMPAMLASVYQRGAVRASRETGIPTTAFPASCPWTLEQVLDEDWLPTD